MGPEPFDKKFNIKYVLAFFREKNKNIKSFLMDQRFVSGVGNIYASEILFLSKIKPNKKVKLLNKIELRVPPTTSYSKILIKFRTKSVQVSYVTFINIHCFIFSNVNCDF